MNYQPTIGLEVHAQLLSKSKLFCAASTRFGEEPNANVHPLCMAMPGTLPKLNAAVVDMAIRTGLALQCTINLESRWDRKHYFYPDLPSGFQVTQNELPICEHGTLSVSTTEGERPIRIRRIHMEEDAGKLMHDPQSAESLVDLNRAGIPLLEIVSAPDIHTAEEAAAYLRSLRDILVYIGVSDGNLEEGSFRSDANVSIAPKGSTTLGTRVEIKNINSFRFVQKAIEYEIARQVSVLENGGKLVQETRLWDAEKGETRSMRSKENAQDYRYFPEPNLPPLRIEASQVEALKKTLPELPKEKYRRYIESLGLPAYDAAVLTAERELAEYFEGCLTHYADAKKLSNWVMGELLRMSKEEEIAFSALRFSKEQFARLLQAVDAGKISLNAAKEVFAHMFRTGEEPERIIEAKGLAQVSDVGAIEAAIAAVLEAHASETEKYRAGKKQVFGFLVGQVMKAMKGKGNPALVNQLLRNRLDN
ncbi:MAG: Asp-tRNA(Asn)/Glu-tRNA(Gln) amidotransferase subunit GatB [Cystobacterineae bacterium]|nr:Asp-tRNA(Asn)/Glu-tRNA(Gln) amidotransferase subunit GatB [Cystobacterineae bacterium]